MARTVLITGGARSGKSRAGQKLAEMLPGKRMFIATCPVIDQEMAERIARHRQERASRGWETIEEPLDLAQALRRCSAHEVVLVDCLTLWVNNLLYRANREGAPISEDAVAAACEEVLASCRRHAGTVIFVTNEVGMGIVPADPMTRLYRDLVGRLNQRLAEAADRVVLVVCGVAVDIKGAQS